MTVLPSSFTRRGFALPTVLIASVVLLIVLAVSVTATTSARNALKDQYYAQLAQVAGEAGVAHAEACLQANNNVVTWTNAQPLTPATNCSGVVSIGPTVNALVVAGGGGGGHNGGGGGGAGGYQFTNNSPVSVQSYPVVVGGGGAAAPSDSVQGSSGSNSSFNGITSIGGGGGASRGGGSPGVNGGSGGAGAGSAGSGRDVPGTGVAGQGYNGGYGTPSDLGCNASGGGGGGAGSVGGNGVSQLAGSAGTGLSNSISGVAVWYAVGSPGGYTCAPGHEGTPAAGGSASGVAPTANTGSGGAGGSASGGSTINPQPGASGVVIISYLTTAGITATGGTISTANGYTVHRFTSNGTFQVTGLNATCPGSDKCWVLVDGNVRSSYSVPVPTLDADSRPVTIEQTGYVEIWRESTNATWRTYRQPAAQAAAVPALCSGAARSDMGWTNAMVRAATGTFPSTTARPIGMTAAGTVSGPVHYRKDFNIVEAGTYTIQAKGDDRMDLYVDGALMLRGVTNTAGSVNVTLSSGCHVIHATVNSTALVGSSANFILGMKKVGAAREIVATDNSWRVSAGATNSYAAPRYAQSANWTDARVISAYNAAPFAAPTDWVTNSGDTTAQWISSNTGYTGNNYPFASYSYFRNKATTPWNLTAATELKFSLACDNECRLYVDGNEVLRAENGSTTMGTTTLTLPAGQHTIGLQLYNTGASDNIAGFLFSAKRTVDNVVIDRSSVNWSVVNAWYSAAQSIQSYDRAHQVSPDINDCNCSTQSTTNIISNPSIETNATGYTGTLLNVGQSALAKRTGNYGLGAQVTSLGAMPRVNYTTTDFEHGRVYTISGHLIGGVSGRMGYQFLDATGTAITVAGANAWYTAIQNPGGSAFARYNITTSAVPAQTASIVIIFGIQDNAAINTQFGIDDVMMTAGPTLYAYLDGSFTGLGWSWYGTANVSPSRGPTVAP